MQPWRLSGAGATLPHIWSQLPWRGCDRAPTILYSLLLCPKQLTPLSQLHSSFHNIMLYLSVLFLFLFFNLKTITSSTLRIPPSNKLIKKNNRVCLWPKGLREQRALRNVRVSCLRPCVCVCVHSLTWGEAGVLWLDCSTGVSPAAWTRWLMRVIEFVVVQQAC